MNSPHKASSVEGHTTQRWPAWPVCLAAAPAHVQEHSAPSSSPWKPSEKDAVLYSGMLLHGKACLLAARATIFNALTHSLSSHLWRWTTIITVSMAMSLWFFFSALFLDLNICSYDYHLQQGICLHMPSNVISTYARTSENNICVEQFAFCLYFSHCYLFSYELCLMDCWL